MTEAAKYAKVVEWSEEDGAFVGRCPGIIGPCCHGPVEVEVDRQLGEIVEEWVRMAREDGKALPSATAGTGVAGKIVRSTLWASSGPSTNEDPGGRPGILPGASDGTQGVVPLRPK